MTSRWTRSWATRSASRSSPSWRFRGYGDFARALDGIKEGNGTLLDNTIVLGFSDTGYAKIHSTDNIPMFIAGGGGGRHKGGVHVVGNGDP